MFLPVPNGSRLDIIFKLKQRGSEMHFVDAKWILTGSGGHYGMNIYRGCTHGCIYCDSRSRCYQFTHPFEDIEVKQNAPKLLEKALKSKRKKCMIGTGTMSDPYMHCEENLRLTRNVWKSFWRMILGLQFRQNQIVYFGILICFPRSIAQQNVWCR